MAAAAEIGFRKVDVRPDVLTDTDAWTDADRLGLSLQCLSISNALLDEAPFASDAATDRSVARIEPWLRDASERGANAAYLVPPRNIDTLDAFGARVARLAEAAARFDVRLCVEHFPGTVLPTAAGTLSWLSDVGHPNLYLLADTGHLSISGEGLADTVRAAGPRLGYLHFDDNDGSADQHLGLTEGVLNESRLRDLLAAVAETAPDLGLSLELHPDLPDPAVSLARSRTLLHSLSR